MINTYELLLQGKRDLPLPIGAEILSVAALSKDTYPVSMYNVKILLWAMIDTEERTTETRQIYIVGAGHPIPEAAGTFIGTIIASPLVWHIFVGA